MTRHAIVALALSAPWLMAPQAMAQSDALSPCRLPGLAHEARCGKVARPLDMSRSQGTAIDIHYAVVPALARSKHDDPVFLIAGGPGQSAIGIAPDVMPLFQRLNRRRDIVFVDQRGTGRSAPLKCDDERARPLAEQADIERAVAELARCRDRLQKLPHGDLRYYTTPLATMDLEAVRAALNAPKVNLVAASYGTRAAIDYARQFPARVRRMVLDGAAPPDMALPASMSPDSEAALDALFAACDREPACQRAHPTLRRLWTELIEALPTQIEAAHPLTGQRERVTLSREMLLQAVQRALYVPSWTSALPQAIADAARGRPEGLLGLASLASGRASTAPAMGMHYSVVCSEDVPRLNNTTDQPGRTFGDAHARLYQRVCASWPRGELPTAFYTLPSTQAPTLVLSGGLDPVTPPRHGERVARALGPAARHIVVPNAGHGVLGVGCMGDLLHRFINAADDTAATGVDASCATGIPRPHSLRPLTLEHAQ
jgi:pimeloyl-ACP methyl ester carboxylesterase